MLQKCHKQKSNAGRMVVVGAVPDIRQRSIWRRLNHQDVRRWCRSAGGETFIYLT